MTRLIDADALEYKQHVMYKKGDEVFGEWFITATEIDHAPIIDAVPVIKCKDCKHRYITGSTTHYYVCDFMDAEYNDNGYCHHGERKDDETDRR